eukprot:COSAG06_NODE_44911_length_359_cov_0.811538_1_plen_104_part_01
MIPANIGKGIGPYSQQLPIPLRLYVGVGISESDEDRDARIQTGDGYPHEAVPGKYCCVWATPGALIARTTSRFEPLGSKEAIGWGSSDRVGLDRVGLERSSGAR